MPLRLESGYRYKVFEGPPLELLLDPQTTCKLEKVNFSHEQLLDAARPASRHPPTTHVPPTQTDHSDDIFADAPDSAPFGVDAGRQAVVEGQTQRLARSPKRLKKSHLQPPPTASALAIPENTLLSQSLVAPSQRLPRDILRGILRPESSAMFYSQASTVGDESLGPPPLFIWELSSLTTFDRFRGILADYTAARKRSKPSVSFLAAVIDIQAARHVGTGGKQKAEWHLQDPTGQQVTLHIWGSGADVVCDVVRRGDIIFVGDAKLSMYQDKLQLSVNHDHGAELKGWQLQIVWRTHITKVEDRDNRINPALRAVRDQPEFARVDKVLEVADWYERAFLKRR